MDREEPGGLQSMGSDDRAKNTFLFLQTDSGAPLVAMHGMTCLSFQRQLFLQWH